MINLILFGPPGSGKGTQAENLVKRYNLLHISTGDLFREEIKNETPLGLKAKAFTDAGELVPDSVTIDMLKNKIESHPEVEGIIFDGFPRTIPQAEALDWLLKKKNSEIMLLVAMNVEDAELIDRLQKRAIESNRPDDANVDVIQNRLSIYKESTLPVFDYYTQFNKSVNINGLGEINDVFSRLANEIDACLNKVS